MVGSWSIVEGEVTSEPSAGLGDGVVRMQIDLLVLDRAPEPLDEDVVTPAAASVHADPNCVLAQDIEEVGARELRLDPC